MSLRKSVTRIAVVAVVLACWIVPAHAQCGPMDVVFVVDNTASMTDVIAQVQQQVNRVADTVTAASNGDYQLGLVVAPANDVQVLLDFSARNRQAFGDAVAKMTTISSCGEPAAWDDGIDTVLHALPAGRKTGGGNGVQGGTFAGQFRANATKIIIVITDARPNHTTGCDFLPEDASFAVGLAAEAAARNIRMATVFVPTDSAVFAGFVPTVQAVLSDMAEVSNGSFLTTQPDASDLPDVIDDVILTCGAGGGLVVAPQEVLLSNGESADVKVTNYRPGKDPSTLFYTSSGLPADSTATFTSVTPEIAGTNQQNLKISIGPDTLAGAYILSVNAGHTTGGRSQASFVRVIVDCQPPMILGTPGSQPANTTVASGAKATLKVAPVGTTGFRYQWYQGHSGSTLSPIAGATSPTLTTPAITSPTEFWVRVTNACGSVDSQTATVSNQ